ncbi:Protein lines [Eumeta japonica]|uniref:Protein lines n=1 Tax=Eumeta variegata TaxID=151549 RepID=A0A4C1ZNZ2_EUMVA|nr:Protein lines [Eumeta japonica]
MKLLIFQYLNLSNSENCVITFFSLWENIISVKANLSVIDTKPFYADLQGFVDLLRNTTLPSLIYTHLLSLFNEVLCYGSTLALQDVLPEEICSLAHSIVRFVKDFRLLSEIKVRNSRSSCGFIGHDCALIRDYSLTPTITSTIQLVDQSYGDEDPDPIQYEVDKTMLQRMALLVLKSIAVTVKEMRCDSSDSSIDSSDYNAIQDMQIVERSIRDVLKKLDVFIRNTLEFHPETPFTKMLIHLFSEQDDYLVESMVCTLDITVGIVYRNSMYPDLIPMLNPIASFVEFLKVVTHDSDVLLDYLVSNETCFLLYLLRFLKYVRRNWSRFLETCQMSDAGGSRGLDDTMRVLLRLRMQISRLVSRSLFPYNISPVLRLLEVCESLYEELHRHLKGEAVNKARTISVFSDTRKAEVWIQVDNIIDLDPHFGYGQTETEFLKFLDQYAEKTILLILLKTALLEMTCI